MATQSNTYMPLIYSVSDDFTVEFPRGYEHIFDRCIAPANKNLSSSNLPLLPFTNFQEFQSKLGEALVERTGTRRMHENRDLDGRYHLSSAAQEDIINRVYPFIDDFMSMFISNLSVGLPNRGCILHPREPICTVDMCTISGGKTRRLARRKKRLTRR